MRPMPPGQHRHRSDQQSIKSPPESEVSGGFLLLIHQVLGGDIVGRLICLGSIQLPVGFDDLVVNGNDRSFILNRQVAFGHRHSGQVTQLGDDILGVFHSTDVGFVGLIHGDLQQH